MLKRTVEEKMNVICIDDEYLVLQRNMAILRKIPQVEAVEGFLGGEEALDYLNKNSADVVFLDINMPGKNGLELAAIFRKNWPEMAIVFLTAYSQFAISAFQVRANGYLLKPVEKEQFQKEIDNVEQIKKKQTRKRIRIVTFGNFDLFLDDHAIAFPRSISKEILAYLVCKKGTGVSRPELAGIIWEDALYDRSRQKQLDVYIRSLLTTLRENRIENLIEKNNGMLRIRPELVECDYYQYLQGDPIVKRQYYGEFMNNYSWAEFLKQPFLE